MAENVIKSDNWIRAGAVYYNNVFSIANLEYTELLIAVVARSDNLFTRVVPKNIIESTDIYLREGYYYSSTSNGSVIVKINSSEVQIFSAQLDGVNVINDNTYMIVYYR